MSFALVLRVDARGALVEVDGRTVAAQLRGALFQEATWATRPVAVGDRVALEGEGDELTIARVEPRRSAFLRLAARGERKAQVIAANVDQVVAVASVGIPEFSSTFVDRMLAGAAACDIPAAVILNKRDVARPGAVDAILATYERARVRAIAISAKTGEGLDDARALFAGKTSVLSGLSGTGKSSLLNALSPGLARLVGHLSYKWKQGKHTTSAAELIHVPSGFDLIDTPGIRGFLPWGVDRRKLRHCFLDFEPLLGACRFADCTHTSEPGCTLDEAVAVGTLARTRLASYREIFEELPPPPEEWSEGLRPRESDSGDDGEEDDGVDE